MSLTRMPVEIIDQIASYVHESDIQAYHSLRLSCKHMIYLPEIKSQKEFDLILKKRYRKDALRLYMKFGWLKATQQFAEKAAEYGEINVLKRLKDVDLQQLFRHSVRMNLANAVSYLVKCDEVDALENDQQALIIASMQGHQEVLEVLLQLQKADPNKCVDYAGTDAIERLLRRDKRCLKKDKVVKTKKAPKKRKIGV